MDINKLDYFISEALSRQLGDTVDSSYFTKEMLESLTSLTINSLTPITTISRLKNLVSLNIIGQSHSEYALDEVIDYSEINNLNNLESLIVINDYHARQLNISNLKKLKILILVSNQNLENIIGLDKLKNLKHVVIVGNSIKNKEWLTKYIINTKETRVNILDYRLFSYVVKNKALKQLLYLMNARCETNLLFAEKIGVGEIFSYTYSMIDKVYTLAQQIIKENIKPEMTEKEKVKVLYNYVINHLDYDTEELRKRDNVILTDEKIIKVYKNKYKFINSSYRAFLEGKVVCEGYVNMLIYLLDLINVEARNVYCTVKNMNSNVEGYYNHSAIKIKIDGNWYYFDPQLEEKNQKNNYFMKTEEEFKMTHNILVTTELEGKQKQR